MESLEVTCFWLSEDSAIEAMFTINFIYTFYLFMNRR